MLILVLGAVLAVLLGAGFELTYLGWLYTADRGIPWLTALLSMTVGAISLAGIGVALEHGHNAPWLILGYGIGSYVAAYIKRARTSRSGGRG